MRRNLTGLLLGLACLGQPALAAPPPPIATQPGLPEDVARTRAAIYEAAMSGDAETLAGMLRSRFGVDTTGLVPGGDEPRSRFLAWWNLSPHNHGQQLVRAVLQPYRHVTVYHGGAKTGARLPRHIVYVWLLPAAKADGEPALQLWIDQSGDVEAVRY